MSIVLTSHLHQLEISPDSTVRLNGLSWANYQEVLTGLGDNRITRLTYFEGIVEIRMPGYHHEMLNRLLELIINILAVGFGQNIRSFGSTKFSREDLAQGVEPDSCFYIEKFAQVSNSTGEFLPPDLVVEVDIASSSKLRLPIYAAMEVPEIWVYRKQRLEILVLATEEYQGATISHAFPQVGVNQINNWLEIGMKSGNLPVVLQVQEFCQSTEN